MIWSKLIPNWFTLFDGKLVDLKIFQIVFAFEFFRTPHTRSAEVDADNLGSGQRKACFAA